MKRFFLCLSLVFYFSAKAQRDTISIRARLNEDQKMISVEQVLIYHNPHQKAIKQIKLLNWVTAYQNRRTHLLKRKVEDRKKDLYFAKDEQLGKLESLQYSHGNNFSEVLNKNQENIYIPLSESLNPGERIKISLNYQIRLPDARFTGYGINANDILLKYFFLVPETFENENQSNSFYRDTEETGNAGSFWTVDFTLPESWKCYSNLARHSESEFSGISINDPEFQLSKKKYPSFQPTIDGEKINIQLGYEISDYQQKILEPVLVNHLSFLKSKTGNLPENIFITQKFLNKEEFFGIDDIKFWKFKYQLFTDYEKADLDYFSVLSKKVAEESIIINKTNDHWLKNGIKSYLEIQYLKKFYPNHLLLGNLPENVKILGIKPLKAFHASKLKLSERYGLAYHYIYTQNLDQKITTPYHQLSNFNTTAISQFETGSLLNYSSEYQGSEHFDLFLKNYLSSNYQKKADGSEFLKALEKATDGNSGFLQRLMNEKHRVNFNLKSIKKKNQNYNLHLRSRNADLTPLKIQSETREGYKNTFWKSENELSKDSVSIPNKSIYKIVLNDDYIFPETNYRDNYIYTKGLFSNAKKIRFKLIKDIQNPEYNEIFLTPRLTFNAYDRVLLGLNFKNQGIFDQKFAYSVTPYYSTGTGKLTGSGAINYSILPPNSFFRRWNFGVSGSYFHYDNDLAYKRFGAGTSFDFQKNPRSAIGRSLYFSYNYYERELTPLMIRNNQYSKYNLWNIGYSYSDNSLIHEKYIGTNLQWMEDFQKISAEAFYRWEFAKDKKISFRLFAGYFLRNETKNALFNYGISRVSNYSFSYGLLGQSATSGILSQQFILAEGGFKSFFNTSVNQFITSINVDSHLWKWFNLYADAGIYKNRTRQAEFIWDSGLKVKVVPDFLEIYFPVASSLGFEPGFKDYGRRIRYTLILNLGALINNLRRGVF
ncbi:aminopeptidase [Epilithonimonas vandammei]|uniref:Aminopeptidase n=1 Tax=Epilithonimonas vandammei TaxID=2487072 RepID=A0A3G8ZJJ2_9FLAO|nr:aminopeptidase [Epilithonimonas vandammei]AZI54684.1 aminopeptidase [Epilithonimonas vandammei]